MLLLISKQLFLCSRILGFKRSFKCLVLKLGENFVFNFCLFPFNESPYNSYKTVKRV